ncbi:RagB/SusD family nutrient uptake outer membrane protein [Paraflavitalea sp. CAU 1676]|uniref:RagB/SusD family nutrient uptake outer membrane protein n=1 Tax=Paraflavitalea sp. CAU 1676 TaxID=3032598 RepID=UPI0023DA72DC|nr:RagB/SusD family nutrient uptake outer membrane protein [Paraflavitalea sp. CAU 1676]MDF2188023.1 RagB/SusD family nutrient uptake outer membrane protein [Paraflavitalea sp. CAU 1676]
MTQKRTYIKWLPVLFGGLLTTASCSKSFLELQPRGTELEDNFYQNQEQVFQGLVSVYDVMQWGNSGGYTMKMPLLSAASDDAYAGGSDASDQPSWVAYDNFTLDAFRGPQLGLWQKNFTGVYRANLLLSKIEKATNLTAAFKTRVIAETKTLRAYFYFDLVRFFGRVPLILGAVPTSELYSQKQAEATAIYAQIEKDLKEARADLPTTLPVSEYARLTKGAATAILGKVILYQNNNGRMAEAAALLKEVNTSAAYRLLPNFGDIFRADNKFNAESILEIPHSNLAAWGDWGWINGGEGNVAAQFVGAADYSGPLYSGGWGFCPITEDLANVMKNDPRFQHTIIDGNAMKAQGAKYNARYQNTDYFVRKYAPVTAFRSSVGTAEINWPINEIEIRLADTYLLEAEALVRGGGDAARSQYLLDTVRRRVNLPSIPANLDNIYQERRLELATEGHRFFDLVRSGKAAAVLGPRGYKANKNEVLPIPQQEIDITNKVLEQNKGY